MEISKAEDNGNVIKEAMSSVSRSSSEFEKDIGSAHVIKKSSSLEAEESSRMVSQSPLDQTIVETSNESKEAAEQGEIINQDLKSTLKDIITEIEEALPENEESTEAEQNDNTENSDCLPEFRSHQIDRQTSTTSLEDLQKRPISSADGVMRESNAAAFLSLLGRGDVGKRPHSLPANLAHLWQSLKIANELNQSLQESSINGGEGEVLDSEASGHKVNIEDGLQPRQIDFEKLFTPASDSGEITPSRSRKVYASSSFYAPYHPTMEEQVELARRISHSLSDISNKESKGQSMYVNRKKRSVKWVHEGEGGLEKVPEIENIQPTSKFSQESKPPLKLVMNPRGQVQDITMLRKQGFAVDSTPSPEVCFDLVRDLNAPKGKGAELFAKRRKRSENWIIDENNVKTPETIMTQSPLSKLPSPSYLQGSSQKVENVQKMNQIQEKFNQPRIKLIKSPWEAALEGSVENAFQEMRQSPRGFVSAPTPTFIKSLATPPPPSPPVSTTPDLYKPKTPRAWNPQPTCKTFSSVKLDKIFAGSPKSPVSLAYHPDTNTISTEPVIVEKIPPIATQLADYEVINQSILHEPKPRRPGQFLIYEPSAPKKQESKEVGGIEAVKEQSHIESENVENQKCGLQVFSDGMSEKQTAVDTALENTKEEVIAEEQSAVSQKIEICLNESSLDSSVDKVEQTESSNIEEKYYQSETFTTHTQIKQRSQDTSIENVTVDEEVEDLLCEKEFNALSLEYENLENPKPKKLASMVPGAVPIFSGLDFSETKMPEVEKGEERKLYRKPGHAVPGAKPLFGNSVDVHVSVNDYGDSPYEKIPVKNLINTFEQSTRPVIKYRQMQDKIPPALSPKTEHTNYINKELAQLMNNVEDGCASKAEQVAHIDTVQESINNMSEEEIRKIQSHYELQKQKKDIYDNQMEKYKEEMRRLRSMKSKTSESGQLKQISTSKSHTVSDQLPGMQSSFHMHGGDVNTQVTHSSEAAPKPATASYIPPSTEVLQAQSIPLSYGATNNYNTAPRGWQKSMSYYRPVTFNPLPAAYTDF